MTSFLQAKGNFLVGSSFSGQVYYLAIVLVALLAIFLLADGSCSRIQHCKST